MALRASRGNRLHITPVLFRKVSQSNVAGVIGVDYAVTGIAIKAKPSERLCSGIDARGMTTGASIGELVFVPARLLRINPSRHATVRQLGLCIEHRELSI